MADRDEKDAPLKSAKAFLEGLKNRPRQPWDELHEEREAPAPPVPPKPRPTSASAPDPMAQAQRLADRNRDIAKRTRHLREN